jgi:CTP:molybdopterin cytidylyltransferase MocA
MTSNSVPAAIILAAGYGSRMGTPKLTLSLGGRSYLEVILGRIRTAGIGDIVVVVQPEFAEFASREGTDTTIAVNPRPERGMISSMHLGIQHMKRPVPVMVVPVDHPFVLTGTYSALIRKAAEFPECVVKPVWKGRPGHPVVIPWKLAAEIPGGTFPGGLSLFIRRSGIGQVLTPVADPGILRNINRPGDIGLVAGRVPG